MNPLTEFGIIRACCILLLPSQMKTLAWNQQVQRWEAFAELPSSSNARATQLHSWDPWYSRYPCPCTSARLMCRAAALGERGVFSQRSSCCLWHSTSHPILQEPVTVQSCLLSGWGTEQVVTGVALSCIERPSHPPSPEDRSCLCHLILKSLTQGRTKSTL